MKGELELEFTPQGTLAERIRAGGAGIPAFYTKSGVGTMLADGTGVLKFRPDGTVEKYRPKLETKFFNGKEYACVEALVGDFAFIRAHKADKSGNLYWKGTTRNFNPLMATASKITIVEN